MIGINGMAHVILTVSRFDLARAFYGKLLRRYARLLRSLRLARPRSNDVRLIFHGTPLVRKSSACEMSQSTVTRGRRTFLCNHADGIACMDLFVVPTLSFRLLYGLLILRHRRRQIMWLGVTANPTAEWIARQVTDACGWAAAPDYVVRDRDRAYGKALIRRLRAMGIRDRPTAPRIALAERLCRTPDWLDQAGGTPSPRPAWPSAPSARTAILPGISQRGPHASVAEQRRADSTRSSRRRVGASQSLILAVCITNTVGFDLRQGQRVRS